MAALVNRSYPMWCATESALMTLTESNLSMMSRKHASMIDEHHICPPPWAIGLVSSCCPEPHSESYRCTGRQRNTWRCRCQCQQWSLFRRRFSAIFVSNIFATTLERQLIIALWTLSSSEPRINETFGERFFTKSRDAGREGWRGWRGSPDLRQPTPLQSISYEFKVWSRKWKRGGGFMRLRQPDPNQLRAVIINVQMHRGRGGGFSIPSITYLP